MLYCFFLVVMFSIDASSENIIVPERNNVVKVCIVRIGDTVKDFTVALQAKMNSAGNIADG